MLCHDGVHRLMPYVYWFGSEANLKQAKGKFQVSWFASLSPFIARHPLALRLDSDSQPPANQVPRSASFRH